MKSVSSLSVAVCTLIPFLHCSVSAFQSVVVVMLKGMRKMRKVVGLGGRFNVAVGVVALLVWSRS